MSLIDIPIDSCETKIPSNVKRLLKVARRRIENHMLFSQTHAFVPSDFEQVYHVLKWLSETDLLRGIRFCEWGSGFGVVTCLADMLGFESYGIEIESELVLRAQTLAEEFGLAAQFAHGSFIPRQAENHPILNESFSWLTTQTDDCYSEFDIEAEDFDLIYAYPWPDEEIVTDVLFHDFAGAGALFLTYNERGFKLQRKQSSGKKKRRPGQ